MFFLIRLFESQPDVTAIIRSGLKKEDAEEIMDAVEMAKEELSKPEPKASRLRNCVTLIAPMFTIANGIPALVGNLQKFVNYVTPYIR